MNKDYFCKLWPTVRILYNLYFMVLLQKYGCLKKKTKKKKPRGRLGKTIKCVQLRVNLRLCLSKKLERNPEKKKKKKKRRSVHYKASGVGSLGTSIYISFIGSVHCFIKCFSKFNISHPYSAFLFEQQPVGDTLFSVRSFCCIIKILSIIRLSGGQRHEGIIA